MDEAEGDGYGYCSLGSTLGKLRSHVSQKGFGKKVRRFLHYIPCTPFRNHKPSELGWSACWHSFRYGIFAIVGATSKACVCLFFSTNNLGSHFFRRNMNCRLVHFDC